MFCCDVGAHGCQGERLFQLQEESPQSRAEPSSLCFDGERAQARTEAAAAKSSWRTCSGARSVWPQLQDQFHKQKGSRIRIRGLPASGTPGVDTRVSIAAASSVTGVCVCEVSMATTGATCPGACSEEPSLLNFLQAWSWLRVSTGCEHSKGVAPWILPSPSSITGAHRVCCPIFLYVA